MKSLHQNFKNIEEEIIFLKKKRKAIILSHFYQDEDIQDIADFVGEENVDEVLRILGLSTMDEESAMATGGVAIGNAPLASGSVRRPKKKKKTNEYIDLSLIDEVMELIMKRGITK